MLPCRHLLRSLRQRSRGRKPLSSVANPAADEFLSNSIMMARTNTTVMYSVPEHPRPRLVPPAGGKRHLDTDWWRRNQSQRRITDIHQDLSYQTLKREIESYHRMFGDKLQVLRPPGRIKNPPRKVINALSYASTYLCCCISIFPRLSLCGHMTI